MSRVHKVATVQFEPTMFEKEPNIARLIELCEAAVVPVGNQTRTYR